MLKAKILKPWEHHCGLLLLITDVILKTHALNNKLLGCRTERYLISFVCNYRKKGKNFENDKDVFFYVYLGALDRPCPKQHVLLRDVGNRNRMVSVVKELSRLLIISQLQ